MGSPRRLGITIFILRSLNLVVKTLYEPSPLPHWDIVGFSVGKPHIIHKSKDGFEIDILFIRRQAKKS